MLRNSEVQEPINMDEMEVLELSPRPFWDSLTFEEVEEFVKEEIEAKRFLDKEEKEVKEFISSAALIARTLPARALPNPILVPPNNSLHRNEEKETKSENTREAQKKRAKSKEYSVRAHYARHRPRVGGRFVKNEVSIDTDSSPRARDSDEDYSPTSSPSYKRR